MIGFTRAEEHRYVQVTISPRSRVVSDGLRCLGTFNTPPYTHERFVTGVAGPARRFPARVLGFLNIAGEWDPTLLLVLDEAVITTFIGYRLALCRSSPF